MAVALTLLSFGATAQQSVNIEPKIKAIASEFENSKGVDCVEISEGLGLTMVKKAFTPQFGKEFMKDVTSMVIIDYSDASNDVCSAIRRRVESLSAYLEEYTPKDNSVKEGEYLKSYATVKDKKHISNFVVITESGKDKIFIYMGGVLNIEKLEAKK